MKLINKLLANANPPMVQIGDAWVMRLKLIDRLTFQNNLLKAREEGAIVKNRGAYIEFKSRGRKQ